MIKVKDVRVKFESFSLNVENIIIKPNKVTFITGKNGTGKTTLLKAIAGLTSYQGFIEKEGVVTYSSQEPVIFRKSALENILYPLRVRKLNPDMYMAKIQEYCDMLEITHLLYEDATNFSSGEKMKVSIIRSVIFNPDYVLLDEPTTHLDMESINELINLVKKLKNDITFIIVTHNKLFMDELQDNVIHLGGPNV